MTSIGNINREIQLIIDVIDYKMFKGKYLVGVICTPYIKHLLDETKSNIQFIASGQGNIGRSEVEPNIILYGPNQLDVGQGKVR